MKFPRSDAVILDLPVEHLNAEALAVCGVYLVFAAAVFLCVIKYLFAEFVYIAHSISPPTVISEILIMG